ncbi:MAG: hypothetical protein J6333_01785, partial [Planctomycetes bacterium]|nr:hypothetical protein [Planctomycetota bacterium]
EYKREAGLKIGFNWHLKANPRKRAVRYMLIDTNFWKSFFRERLFTAMGDPGCLSLWGEDEEQSRLIAEHLSSEVSEPTAGRGRRVDVWTALPGRENHWLDCVVGDMAGASMLGCALSAGDLAAKIINNSRRATASQAPAKPSNWTVRRFGE